MENQHPKTELRTSEDGSSTLYRADLDEHYHSIHGAIQESTHVFIKAGLNEFPGQILNILDVGFGTGLNALLTMLHAEERTIHYHAVERWPLPPSIVSKINYPACLANHEAASFFHKLHQAQWNVTEDLTARFSLFKEFIDIRDFRAPKLFHVIYFDAFAPDKQPELWTTEIFEKMAGSLAHGGVLTTYSVKGTVKRAMKQAGLTVTKIPGPPGKREMLRAIKP